MAAVGIVCEYNPFHLGHEKQLRMARELLGGGFASDGSSAMRHISLTVLRMPAR